MILNKMKNEISQYFDQLWPINRSLTGNGNRETLRILSKISNIEQREIPSGTQCFDWTIPPEWNVSEAWIKNREGKKIVDFAESNLHLLGYSEPFSGLLEHSELSQHIHTLPDQPDLIPYLTSYYKRRWGFCLRQNDYARLDDSDQYEVFIDSKLDENGSMTVGESLITGSSGREILFSTYICHPSLANNELSGPLVSSFISRELRKRNNLKYNYRFIYIPETIGSIYYLSKMGDYWKNSLDAGFVVTCIGDSGPFNYKRSRRGDSLVDRATELVLQQSKETYFVHDFYPSGSDERQYCSPGFNLPIGSLMRSVYKQYDEYHTSGDNRDFVSFEAMESSVKMYLNIVDVLEHNEVYINTNPCCEPQLGKRGLYPSLGSQKKTTDAVLAIFWILNMADGTNDLIEISRKSKIAFSELSLTAQNLKVQGLLEVK